MIKTGNMQPKSIELDKISITFLLLTFVSPSLSVRLAHRRELGSDVSVGAVLRGGVDRTHPVYATPPRERVLVPPGIHRASSM